MTTEQSSAGLSVRWRYTTGSCSRCAAIRDRQKLPGPRTGEVNEASRTFLGGTATAGKHTMKEAGPFRIFPPVRPGRRPAGAAAGGVLLLGALAQAVPVLGAAPARAAAPVMLVDAGKPAATIVVADDPVGIALDKTDPATQKKAPMTQADAAGELQRCIEKATGARLEIVPAAKAPAEGTLLLVGRSAVSERHGLALPDRPEGLRIATFARGLAILGEVAPAGDPASRGEVDRGTLHGVYEFLERVVGYRFFVDVPGDPDLGTVTPAVGTITLPEGYELELAPDFPYRAAGFTGLVPRVARHSVGFGFPGASWTDRFFGQMFLGEHPDWRAMTSTNGTRSSYYPCYSHPGVLEARVRTTQDIYDGKGRWFGEHGHPGPKWIFFEPAGGWDADGLCLCQRCLPQYRPGRGRLGKNSNLVFRHGADFAAEIARRWPDKRLVMLATQGHTLPPDFDLPDNVDVQVFLARSSGMAKEPYWHERNLKLLQDWHERLGGRRDRLYVWDFLCRPKQWTEAPVFFPHSLQRWLRDIHPLCAGERVSEGSNPPQFEMVMAWLWHRLMWDRNADVDALLRDQCTTLFGPAGPAMERVYATVIDRYENVHWSREFDDAYVPPEQMYGETYTPPVVDTLKRLMREALDACPSSATNICRRRVEWMREAFAPFFAEADLAHRWLEKTPTYAVADAAEPPADDAAWEALPAATLVQGQYGETADLATRVRLARCGTNVFVRFEADEPVVPMIVDRLAVFVKGSERKPPLHVTGEGTFPHNKLPQELAGYAFKDGVWKVTLKFPAAELGIAPGGAGAAEVQFERRRAARGKTPATEYFWMPPMRPRSPEDMRFGRIEAGQTGVKD